MRAFVDWCARLAVAALGLTACGDGGDGDPSEAFTVWAFEEQSGPEGQDTPLAGAEVAFDPPDGGARVTATIAADGHATFEADFSAGGGAITIFERDHVLVSAIDASPSSARVRPNTIGKAPSDLVVFAPRLDDALRGASVELRGALLSKRDAATVVDLSASGLPRLGSIETTAPTYVLRAPRGRPFFLLGHEVQNMASAGTPPAIENEIIGSFRVDVSALEADTTKDLDVSAARLPVRPLRLRTEMPAGARSPFGAGTRGFATVVSADSGILVAPIKSSRPTADGRGFDIELSVAETSIAPERPLTRASLVAADGSRSVRTEMGIVPDATTWSDFLAPAAVPEATSPSSLADRLPLDDFPAGAELRVEIYAGTQLAWIVTGPAGGVRAPVTLPAPLEIRLPALVAVSIAARMDHVALGGRGEIFRRVAISRDVPMRR